MTSSQTSAAERARRTAGWRPKPGLRSAMIALFATMMVANTAHADDRQDLIAALKGAKGGEEAPNSPSMPQSGKKIPDRVHTNLNCR